jgi:hypothetical protein
MSGYIRGSSEVLEAIADIRPSPSGWIRAVCPYCLASGHETNKKKLSVSLETGFFQCWRADCGAKGFIEVDERALKKYKKAPTEEKPDDGRVPLPADFTPLNTFSDAISLKKFYAYLKTRFVKDQTIVEANLGACLVGEYANKVVIPVYHRGEVAGFTSRSVVGKDFMNPPKFKRTHYMLNGDALLEESTEPVVIVEGPFDCLRHWPYAVACFGKPTHHHEKLIREAKRPVIIGLDADAQMEGWGLAMKLELEGRDVRFLKIRPGTDPGKTPHEEFMEWASTARRASSTNPSTSSILK